MNPTSRYSNGYWTEGKIVNGTNVGGGKFIQGPKPTPTTTPAPTTTTAPTVTKTTEPTLKDRYAPEREKINTSPVYNVEKPNEEAIRDTYRQRNMAYVNAIKSQFDKYIAEDTRAKQDLSSKAYIGALAGGLSGSISGASKEYKAAETGEKKIRETKAQRDLLIAQLEEKADLRASEEFGKRRSEYLSSAQDKEKAELALSGNIRKTAEAEISEIAQGRTYAELSPKLREQYKKELNLDDEQLEALFISKTPQAKEVKLGDGSIAYFQQTTDENGNVTMKEVGRIKGSAGKTIKDSKITDNGVQILYSDGTYEFKGNSSSDKQPITQTIPGTPANFTQDDVANGRDFFARSGSNGYADPGLYYAVYKKWIENGGTQVAFKKLYPPEEFADPRKADLYPTFLQPSTTVVKKEVKTIASPSTTTAPTGSGRTY